ncbi:MAG TPA: glycoside hydrolase family 20 zincin-like fold domain-containing protein, partial [Lacibacter sp.]|nr:glycoside hydrolase family 20 zincin-like fold domain-containing protein [Lacibacter sp.]
MVKTIFAFTSLSIFAITANAQTTSQLIPKKGMFVATNNLTWITGSEINFLTPQRNNHHYYFTWWEQDEVWNQHGTTLQIGSENTAVYGTYNLLHKQKDITTSIQCQWNQDDSALADIVYAKLWLPFLSNAEWRGSNNEVITDLANYTGAILQLTTPFGTFVFQSNHPFKIKLNVNLQPGEKDYTARSQYLVIYENNIPVNKLMKMNRSFSITEVRSIPASTKRSIVKTIQPENATNSWTNAVAKQVVLPQPKLMELSNEQYIIPSSKPVSVAPAVQQYRDNLRLHWQIGNNYFPNIQTQQNDQLADEGYQIEIKERLISIQYKTPQGLQHAVHTLVQLTKNENGQLIIPQGIIKDEPAVAWRGIHMFTGPTSWQLHKRMYDRILFPLKMNKVVLQCEQAQWKIRPEL